MGRALVLLGLLGCGGLSDDPPCDTTSDECTARRVVRENLRGDWVAPTLTLWLTPCPYGDGRSAVIVQDACYAGTYWLSTNHVDVAWRGSWHASAYAHECLHAWLWWTTGDTDGEHTRTEWYLEGEINAKLLAIGL